jgi:hypothetical protein
MEHLNLLLIAKDSDAQLVGSLKARAEDIVARLQEIQFGLERNSLQWYTNALSVLIQ